VKHLKVTPQQAAELMNREIAEWSLPDQIRKITVSPEMRMLLYVACWVPPDGVQIIRDDTLPCGQYAFSSVEHGGGVNAKRRRCS